MLSYLTQNGAGQTVVCSPLFSLKDGEIRRYHLTTEYAVHFISGTVEGNDARAVMWEGYQLECTSIPLWSRYSDGTKLQLEDVLSHVIDILSHSLGPLSSALSTADWSLQNRKEDTPVSAIIKLSEAYGTQGFTIRIIWSWILKQWIEFNKGSAVAFVEGEWVTPDVGNMRQGKSYIPLWITNATELFPRTALSVNVSLPIWRTRKTDIPSCPCWQIRMQDCDDLFRWHKYFYNVTDISIQDKRSFNQTIWNQNYGEAYWPCKVCGLHWYLGKHIFHCPYSHRMWHSALLGATGR